MSAFLDQQIDLQNVRPGATAILKLSRQHPIRICRPPAPLPRPTARNLHRCRRAAIQAAPCRASCQTFWEFEPKPAPDQGRLRPPGSRWLVRRLPVRFRAPAPQWRCGQDRSFPALVRLGYRSDHPLLPPASTGCSQEAFFGAGAGVGATGATGAAFAGCAGGVGLVTGGTVCVTGAAGFSGSVTVTVTGRMRRRRCLSR